MTPLAPAPSDSAGALSVVGSVLRAYDGLQLAIVYGSVAAGTTHAESDLDVAVLAQAPLDAPERLALVAALGRALGRAVDLVDLRKTHGALLNEILHHGVRVVERDPAAFPTLLSRLWLDGADFEPLRERILTERCRAWLGTPTLGLA